MGKRTREDLRQMQSLPLAGKIIMTQRRIREWYDHWAGEVYVSFSGGKDSTVLLHLVREMFPDVEAVFVNTGLEYPEIQKFVKTFDNVTILRPEMRFDQVVKEYGYPVISKAVSRCVHDARKGLRFAQQQIKGEYAPDGKKSMFNYEKYEPIMGMDFKVSDKCCAVMKKKPFKAYEKETGKKPYIATMASEGMQREASWLRSGCNAFDSKRARSAPMSFWTEQDVLKYIKENNLPIASVYGEVAWAEDPDQMRLADFGLDVGYDEKLQTTMCDRTGCIFCAYGCHLDKGESRFERLRKTHPRQYEYCIGGGEYDENGTWKPNKQGLGMGHVFDELNKIYGDDFIRYK